MNASDTPSYLLDLNTPQREAVTYQDGPVLVIAGAGSGKTRVLVYKLVHLLHLGYAPQRLMALTFTNKAAHEMRERVIQQVGERARRIRMGTFHSIFLAILRQHAELLGYTPEFTIYNASDSRRRVTAIVKDMGLNSEVYKATLVCRCISNAKNRLITAKAYRSSVERLRADKEAGLGRMADIYARYSSELKQSNAMDFDDLLLQTNILFRDYPDVLQYWQDSIDYLLIDEYQDTNLAQFMIARQLMQRKGAICVVGDDAQSIYSFRGANIDNILTFGRTFEGVKTFKLEQNYRSTQTIVQAAGAVIAHNEHQIPKQVFSLGDVGDPIEIHEASSAEEEASWVVSSIQRRYQYDRVPYEDCVVLYRTNAQSRILEQVFRERGIPFSIWGGRSFFDRKEIMDVVAYFRLVVNEADDEAFLRVVNYPKRGIGDTTLGRLREQAQEVGLPLLSTVEQLELSNGGISKAMIAKLQSFVDLIGELREIAYGDESFYDRMQRFINRTGILSELSRDTSSESRERQENIQELLVSIEEYEHKHDDPDDPIGLASYLSNISLLTDTECTGEQEEARGVLLMTIHSSKGLEFSHVYIVGLEEQLFPSILSMEGDDLEEERRLMYVALTRAGKTCHIGYARERFRNGRIEYARPSRFLRELPQPLVRYNGAAADTLGSSSTRHLGRDIAQRLPDHFSPHSIEVRGQKRGRLHHIGQRSKDEEPVQRHSAIGVLKVGMRVSHPRFGEGEIMMLEGDQLDAKAQVGFDSGETKILLLRYAKLVPLE